VLISPAPYCRRVRACCATADKRTLGRALAAAINKKEISEEGDGLGHPQPETGIVSC
jgi:hypothetical protein